MNFPYRASADPRRFSDRQTREQQQAALSSLSLTLTSRGEFRGQLAQLRDAIKNRGELIPGRSVEESLQMVDMSVGNRLGGVQDRAHDRPLVIAMWGVAAMVGVGMLCLLLNVDPFKQWFADVLLRANGF